MPLHHQLKTKKEQLMEAARIRSNVNTTDARITTERSENRAIHKNLSRDVKSLEPIIGLNRTETQVLAASVVSTQKELSREAPATRSSLSDMKQKLRQVGHKVDAVASKAQRAESATRMVSADSQRTRRDTAHQAFNLNEVLRSYGQLIQNKISLNGDDAAAMSAAALNAAAAGAAAATTELSLGVQFNAGTLDAPLWKPHRIWPAGLLPKLVSSKDTVVDADVEAPLFYNAEGPAPSLAGGTSTWPGGTAATATVTMTDTAGAEVGKGLFVNGMWFEVTSVTEDTSADIVNPYGLTLPTGASITYVGFLPVLNATGSLRLTLVLDTNGTDKDYVDAENVKLTGGLGGILKPVDLSDVTDKVLNIPISA